MKAWSWIACALLSVVTSYGGTEVAGLTFAGDTQKATIEVENHYKNEESLLKMYKNGGWVDVPVSDLKQYANIPTYVISHGLNSGYDSGWISTSAKAIADAQKEGSEVLILSVNWEQYSGFLKDEKLEKQQKRDNDSNYAASTWINAVSTVLSKDLGDLKNIKSFVGHSYGAHLLAETAVKMSKANNLGENQISFVALDPAEETLTFTGDKNGNPTLMWDKNKKSKDWNLPSNIISEEYKSSGLLGTEERLCDYNYFVAEAGSITPKAIGGDLQTGLRNKKFIDNHSVAPNWFAEHLTDYVKSHGGIGGYQDSELIAGWFNAETDASRGERVPNGRDIQNAEKGWDGIVNATSGDLEYRSGNQTYKQWQDMANAEAQALLYRDSEGNTQSDKSNWKGTVLNEEKYDGYRIWHGNENTTPSSDESGVGKRQSGNNNTSSGNDGYSGNGSNSSGGDNSTTTGDSPQRGTISDSGNPIIDAIKDGYNRMPKDENGLPKIEDNFPNPNQRHNDNGQNSENGSDQNNAGGMNNDTTNPQNKSDDGSVPFELSPEVEKVVNQNQNSNTSGGDTNTSNNDDGARNSEQVQNADGQTNPPQNNKGQSGGNGGTSDDGVSGAGDAGTVDGSGSTNDGAGGAAASNQRRPQVSATKDDFVVMPTTITQKSDVDNLDMSPLAKQILKEYLTGESNVLPPDFIPGAFGSLSTDVKDQKTIMQEAYVGEIAKIVGNDTAEKNALTQAIEGFVNAGDGNGMKAFEDMLSQTVDPSQKDKILSLTEAFKNAEQDGGKSLIEKMGEDGQAVTDSLIVNEIKKQIGDALPKDVADEVNGLLGTLDNKNLSKDTKAKILEQVQKLVGKAVPEYSANAINSILQKVIDGTSMQTLEEAKNLGKGIAADVLKGVIEKNLDPKLAKELNALIDGYMKNGVQGLTDAAKKELEALIDQYAPGVNTAKLLKNAVNGIISGQANPTTWKDVATSVVADTANKLIDQSNLPPDVKRAAKEAVNGLAQNGLTGLTTNMQQFITDFVTDKLGKDAGEAAGKIFNAIVTPGVDPWQEIVNQAPVIGAAVGQKFLSWAEEKIGAQIDRLIDKCPALKLVLSKLGIDGKGIIHGVVNVIGVLVSAPDLQTAIAQLSKMGLNFLKNVAAKLIDWALEWAVGWINNNLVPKVLDWASATLGKWADSAKAGGLIQKGLEWLQQQCQNCKKCGGIKINTAGTGKKVVDWLEKKVKKTTGTSSGTTVLTSP